MFSPQIQQFLDSLGMFGWRLGLETTESVLSELGNPHRRYQTIHIAGSNGKGSVARILEAIYLRQGYRVGLYTSPHLVSPTERIRIGGVAVTDAAFEAGLLALQPVLVRHQATYFEVLTVLAFHLFAEAKVEIAIIETGLGGRLDATNVITPICSVITSISREHTSYLGATVSAIAAEKAGIVKKGVPCVVGDLPGDADAVIRERCQESGSPFHRAHDLFAVRHIRVVEEGTCFQFRRSNQEWRNGQLALIGRHQVKNAMTVLACLAQTDGFLPTDENRVWQALREVRWTARLQIVPGHPKMIWDVAHNPESMAALVDTLAEIYPHAPFAVVIGVLDDKDIAGVLTPWQRLDAHLICTTPLSNRALAAERLRDAAVGMKLSADAVAPIEPAVEMAKEKARAMGAIVIVTGSHFVVGPMLAVAENHL